MLAKEPFIRSRSLKYLQQQERRIPTLLDLNYVTNQIIVASQPVADEEATYRDVGRPTCEGESAHTEQQNQVSERGTGTPLQSEDSISFSRQPFDSAYGENGKEDSQCANDNDDTSLSLQSDIRSRRTFNSTTKNGKNERRNAPYSLAKFLNKRHGEGNYLLFSLCDDKPDDTTLLHLRRQIVQLPWKSSSNSSSEIPTVPSLISICYSLFAWLSMERVSDTDLGSPSSEHVAVIYCSNGKTRTAIATACYLKFTGQIDKTEDGFLLFLEKRCPESELSPSTVAESLPASMRTFFKNFDATIELKRYMNRQPLLLRSISVRGVPVEEKPCLDIFNARGEHLYSSHPDLFEDIVGTNPYAQHTRSRWDEEEGFFTVSQILEGDFYLLCRFGGQYASDLSDATKIIFRYANTTGFLRAGPVRLRSDKVDLMRRYSHLIDCQEFMLSLAFEASWNCSRKQEAGLLQKDGLGDCEFCVLGGYLAMEEGWEIIARHHSAKPSDIDVDLLHDSCHGVRGCPFHISSLALQLCNFDFNVAENMLCEGKMRVWWSPQNMATAPALQSQPVSHAPAEFQQEHFEIRDKILSLVRSTEAFSSIDTNATQIGISSTAAKSSMRNVEEVYTPLNLPDSSSWYTSALMRPESGDITNALRNKDFSYPMPDRRLRHGDQPVVPVYPCPLPIMQGTATVLDDPLNRKAFEMLMLVNRPDVSMNDLLVLQRSLQKPSTISITDSAQTCSNGTLITQCRVETDRFGELASQLHRDQLKEAERDDRTLKDVPLDMPDDKSLASQRSAPAPAVASEHAGASEPPLRDDPCFAKYYKMTKMGLPRGAVENAMTRDGADLSLLDLDPDKSLASQRSAPAPAVASEHAGASEPPLRDDPCFAKYYKMTKMGPPRGAVENAMTRDGADLSLLDLDPDKSLASQRSAPAPAVASEHVGASEPPLRDDPCFAKYYKMTKMGLPRGAVENAMTRDGADLSLLDLDPDKSLASQRSAPAPAVASEHAAASEPPLRDDPCFAKYYKMTKMGLPRGAVENAMTRDGADLSLLDLDPDKSLASQRSAPAPAVASEHAGASEPPLRDDPCFAKYYKMTKMGLPRGAVENAMTRDGADLSLLDLDPDKSLASQRSAPAPAVASEHAAASEPPLRDDPCFAKYYKMTKMGLPRGAVENAMTRDGADLSLLDLDPDKSLASQRSAPAPAVASEHVAASEPPLRDDPCFAKYYKMTKMGLPRGAVENAMTRDGADLSLLDLDPDKSLASQRSAPAPAVASEHAGASEPPLRDDPCFAKYYKMTKMGLPRGAVENAMTRDGADLSLLDLDPDKSLLSQKSNNTNDGTVLESAPSSSVCDNMLGGTFHGAAGKTKKVDGTDTPVMHQVPVQSQISHRDFSSQANAKPQQNVVKKNVRRKKIFWNPINPGELKEDSLWSLMKGKVQMDNLDYDVREFEDLFTESPDAGKAKKKKATKRIETKKSVQVVDGKRSMNGGIILKRLRIDYKTLAEMVDAMEVGDLDANSIKALKEYLPTGDETNQLRSYMNAAGDSEEMRQKLYADLSDCEKYMVCMMNVSKAEEHFDCMLFRAQFRSRFDELTDCVKTVDKACDEVRSSEKFRQIMAIILTVVNQINTGGEGKGQALGFSLDALLKLNEAKAFDKKTSVLQYLIKVVKRNDESLIEFHKDLPHINDSVNIILDSLCTDIKVLKDELEGVHKTSQEQADELLDLGKSTKLSLSELKEQRTNVRTLSGVSQFNQVDHLTGRTPMERFSLHAKTLIDDAFELTSQVQDKFKKLLQYFGEDEKMASNEFFGTLKRFIIDFNNVNQIVQKEEKMRLRELKRQESADQRNSKAKETTQLHKTNTVAKSEPASPASAISAFFAAKKPEILSGESQSSGLEAASVGVDPPDRKSVDGCIVASSVVSPIAEDEEEKLAALSKNGETDNTADCEGEPGSVSPASAMSAFFGTDMSEIPKGEDQRSDLEPTTVGDGPPNSTPVDGCIAASDVVSPTAEEDDEKEIAALSKYCETDKTAGCEGESGPMSAASAISAFFEASKPEIPKDEGQSSGLEAASVGFDPPDSTSVDSRIAPSSVVPAITREEEGRDTLPKDGETDKTPGYEGEPGPASAVLAISTLFAANKLEVSIDADMTPDLDATTIGVDVSIDQSPVVVEEERLASSSNDGETDATVGYEGEAGLE